MSTKSHDGRTLRFYSGLILAGTASACLTTLFGLLHLQVFLKAYHLPLAVYSVGSSIFAAINTANDVAGAWLVDSLTYYTGKQRHELVGYSGCVFALAFLTPFFRNASIADWQGFHFVSSLSLYDTMWSFHCILLASIITDNSSMSDRDRVRFLAAGKIVNMLIPMAVARLALAVFDVDNLQPLRRYLLIIAGLVSGLSLMAQKLLTPGASLLHVCKRQKTKVDQEDDTTDDKHESKIPPKTLQFRQVVRDFCQHRSFRYWICMEMLQEGQTTFLNSFLKTFVDELLFDNANGISRATCDWFLSSQHTLIGITQLLLYIPIRRYGYAKLYSAVFLINIILSLSLIFVVGGLTLDEHSDLNHKTPIFLFLAVYPILTSAMGSAGFGLAMADMVLELKLDKAQQGRWDEPSLAGLFMGVNALFCKPVESVLPIVTATLLGSTNFHADSQQQQDTTSVATVLLRLLVLPPLVCSIFQLWAWSHYNLHPTKTKGMRQEWESIERTKETEESQQILRARE